MMVSVVAAAAAVVCACVCVCVWEGVKNRGASRAALMTAYHKQLTEGCGSLSCANSFCCASGRRAPMGTAFATAPAITAMQRATERPRRFFLCLTEPAPASAPAPPRPAAAPPRGGAADGRARIAGAMFM